MSEYKRDHPRIRKNLAVEIIAPGGKKLFSTTYDVSKRGVQLACDGVTVREIFGGPVPSLPTKLPTVILKLRVNHPGSDPEQVEAECRAVFARRISEQGYRVGLSIHTLSAASRAALNRFVDQCLERD